MAATMKAEREGEGIANCFKLDSFARPGSPLVQNRTCTNWDNVHYKIVKSCRGKVTLFFNCEEAVPN